MTTRRPQAVLDGAKLGRYLSSFIDNDIDDSLLADLTDQDLRELGLSLGHRKKLLRALSVDSEPTPVAESTGHLCHPSVLIETQKTELRARYEALRNITLLIDDELVGEEKELVVWFAAGSKQQTRSIAF